MKLLVCREGDMRDTGGRWFDLQLLTYLQTGAGSVGSMTQSTLRFCVCFKIDVTAATPFIRLVSCVCELVKIR